MHDTAFRTGQLFFESYLSGANTTILEIGSQDINGSLRAVAPEGARYLGLDLAPGKGVDVVLQDPTCLPFEEEQFDAVIATSSFEHDPMFWVTFLEMVRVSKKTGYTYISAPSNGKFHRHPLDNWRFYPDAGLSLGLWAQKQGFDVTLIESFTAKRLGDQWNDFVAIFGREDAAKDGPKVVDSVEGPMNVRRWPALDVIENHIEETEDQILVERERRRPIVVSPPREVEIRLDEARVQERAHFLWVEAGRPGGDGREYWERAVALEADGGSRIATIPLVMVGFVDRFFPPDVIVGWAYIPVPGLRVEVTVCLDGRPIGRTVADMFRADLVRFGDGRYGFRVTLEQPLDEINRLDTISLRGSVADQDLGLLRWGRHFSSAVAAASGRGVDGTSTHQSGVRGE